MSVLDTPTTPATGQADEAALTAKVDQLFAEWDQWDVPGAALAVIKEGTIIYKRGYGCANLEYNIPITPSTIFHVASVSKQFTAAAITMLAQQGKLSLDDDVRQHLADLPDFGQTITIRHLIHHTSGLRDQWQLLAMAGWRLDDVITRAHIMKMVKHQRELNFDPGEEHLYCNTGYTLLAEIVERVTGQSFRDYTEANIFKPLGMANTHFHDDHERVVPNRAYSYQPDEKGGFKKSGLNYANVGATSLFTTVEDLAKWMQNFADGRVGGLALIEQMHQQGVLNGGEEIDYAFGLAMGEYRGLRRVGHSGGDAGYRSHVVRFPEHQFAVAILSNWSEFKPARLAMQVADIYLADHLEPQETPAELSPITVDPAIYDDYVGQYQYPDGFLANITRENDRLVHQVLRWPKAELLPVAADQFYLKDFDERKIFQRDEAGVVTQFTSHENGEDTVVKKVNFTLAADRLGEFVGDFYSPELGTTYTLSVEDDRLIAHHRRHDDISLTPTAVDQFAGDQWWFVQLHFSRDENEQVSGFKLSGGRIRNLSFDKLAQER